MVQQLSRHQDDLTKHTLKKCKQKLKISLGQPGHIGKPTVILKV